MICQTIRDELPENSVVFDNPSFDKSIVGYESSDPDEPRVIYNYDKMVAEFMEDNDCSEDDAIDFIDYNTLGTSTSPYGKVPIVMYPIETEDT